MPRTRLTTHPATRHRDVARRRDHDRECLRRTWQSDDVAADDMLTEAVCYVLDRPGRTARDQHSARS